MDAPGFHLATFQQAEPKVSNPLDQVQHGIGHGAEDFSLIFWEDETKNWVTRFMNASWHPAISF